MLAISCRGSYIVSLITPYGVNHIALVTVPQVGKFVKAICYITPDKDSEILLWDIKSYLTNAIIPRLHTLVALELMHVKWRHSYVKVTHLVKLHLAYSGVSGSLFLNLKKKW